MAEVSSFQLEHTRKLRPDVSCWLNFAPDHLDWHPSLDHYSRAKAKSGRPRGLAVLRSSTPTTPAVRRAAGNIPTGVEVVSFGSHRSRSMSTEPR